MWTDSARRQYRRLAARYATDLTDAEFALIEPRLPRPSRIGRPRRIDLRAVLDAIFYLLRTGCQWRLLPREFPPKSTVYDYFRRWWADGTLLGVYHALLELARAAASREPQPTAGIVDSQSVKTAEAGGPRGFDAGKKINGRKRHLLVDTLGLPLRMMRPMSPTMNISCPCRWIGASRYTLPPGLSTRLA
ncbi:MAG: IS5 family transposase [Sphingomonadales bacterium]|nr:IS5 family transposase [Sphingomonadales bacterium]